MPHQDGAGGLLRSMGSHPKNVDFQGDPKVGQESQLLHRHSTRTEFSRRATPLSGRPILSFMYKDKVYYNLQLLSLMLQATFTLLYFRVELVRRGGVCPLAYINQQIDILKRSIV